MPVERMDLIQGYRDEGDESQKKGEEEALPQPVLKKMHVNAAPTVQVKRQVLAKMDGDGIDEFVRSGVKNGKAAEI